MARRSQPYWIGGTVNATRFDAGLSPAAFTAKTRTVNEPGNVGGTAMLVAAPTGRSKATVTPLVGAV